MQAVDGHRKRQRGKDKVDTVVKSVLINFGDDLLDIKGNFVTLTSPVPEPSTWALLAAGVFGVGFMARRQRAARA